MFFTRTASDERSVNSTPAAALPALLALMFPHFLRRKIDDVARADEGGRAVVERAPGTLGEIERGAVIAHGVILLGGGQFREPVFAAQFPRGGKFAPTKSVVRFNPQGVLQKLHRFIEIGLVKAR